MDRGCAVTCHNLGGGVIVCGPPAGVYMRRILSCGVCQRRHRFVVQWDGAWYGYTLFGACGDKWADGEMYPRPFKRGWRKKAQARFRAMWDNAATRESFERYVRADRAMYGPEVQSFRQERKAARRLAVAHELIRRERAA